jgi:hypothetical protein
VGDLIPGDKLTGRRWRDRDTGSAGRDDDLERSVCVRHGPIAISDWRTGRAIATHGITSVVTLAAEIGRQHLGIVRDLPGFTGKPDPPGLEHIGIIRDLEGETCILLH